MDNNKLAEYVLSALLPQLKLDVTKPEEAVKLVSDLCTKIESALRNLPHNVNFRQL